MLFCLSQKAQLIDPGKSREMIWDVGFFSHNDNTTQLQWFLISLTSLQDLCCTFKFNLLHRLLRRKKMKADLISTN